MKLRDIKHFVCILSLIFSDILAFAAANALFRMSSKVPRLLFYRGLLPFEGTVDLFCILAGIFIFVRYLLGDYSRRQLFWDGTRQTTISLMLCSVPSILLLLFSGAGFSTIAILGSWGFTIIAIPTFRQAMRLLLRRLSIWQLPTAIIGEGRRLEEAASIFLESLSLGFDLRFLVTNEKPIFPAKVSRPLVHIALLDSDAIAKQLIASGCLKAVFVAEQPQSPILTDLTQRLMIAGIDVVIIPPLSQLPMLGTTMNFAFGRDFLLLHFRNNLLRLPSRFCKRVFDIIGSTLLLILLSPLFLVIILMIRRTDGGDPFFLQQRVGRRGVMFACIKFQTMHADAEEILSLWKAENSPLYHKYVENNFKLRDDPRVTRIGGWLRRTSLDELPQLINVLKGEMSLVGPRPLIQREVAAYGSAVELYKQTRPGMTGLWQISGRSSTTFADRVSCDGWYIRNWSLWYDLVILMKTAAVLLRSKNAY